MIFSNHEDYGLWVLRGLINQMNTNRIGIKISRIFTTQQADK